jgi:hypothetical protein
MVGRRWWKRCGDRVSHRLSGCGASPMDAGAEVRYSASLCTGWQPAGCTTIRGYRFSSGRTRRHRCAGRPPQAGGSSQQGAETAGGAASARSGKEPGSRSGGDAPADSWQCGRQRPDDRLDRTGTGLLDARPDCRAAPDDGSGRGRREASGDLGPSSARGTSQPGLRGNEARNRE